MHALGLEFGSAAQLSQRSGSMWNCLWGNALKRSPGIIRKSRVSYLGPGFLSCATWPSLPKKHYNGLNQTTMDASSLIFIHLIPKYICIAVNRMATHLQIREESAKTIFDESMLLFVILLTNWSHGKT